MLTGVTILVVDDEDIVCRSCEAILTEEGCDVAVVHSAAAALREMNTRKCRVWTVSGCSRG
jgi:DNA-binding NtrC family response regulator